MYIKIDYKLGMEYNQISLYFCIGMSEKLDYYKLDCEKILEILKSNKNWLKTEEIKIRLDTYWKNILKVKAKTAEWLKFLQQFKDALIILLIISAWICVYLQDYRWATILSIIVVLNAIIWYVQEAKAEKIMQSLKKMLYPTAKVKRDWILIEIKSEDLVPWDIIYMQEWDSVPADLRIFEENELLGNDFSLTGESNPINKFTHAIPGDVPLGERNNCLWMWTTVAVGSAWWIVIATWMDTELGKIANMSQEVQLEATPLQKEMTNIAQKLSIWTIILSVILVIVALLAHFTITEAFIFAVGIAASMVPQWLPAQVNIALSLAAWRLAKNKALVKQLSSVETLWCVNVICTDKTWTLTKNEMTVRNIFLGNKLYEISGVGYETVGELYDDNKNLVNKSELVNKRKHFFNTLFMDSNAKVNPPDNEHPLWHAIWDPTEAALVSLAEKVGLNTDKLDSDNKELHQYWFDSVRKMMSSIRAIDGEIMVYLKWSPKSVLEKCNEIFDGKEIRKIEEKDKEDIMNKVDELASQARRNLAIAYRKLDKYDRNEIKMEEVESNLIFLGFVSIIDPPREEVYGAIKTAYESKIKVIMITWDYWLTAEAIARDIGFGKDEEIRTINWDELKNLSDIDLAKHLVNDRYIIFSRTAPEDKMRIVNLLKKNQNIVAVTGDGINDAPALKNANIWVAMGKIWSDVAKEASEIVLMDDSFNTLVYAIKEWRIIYQNLRKTILACITSNGWELFAILASLVAKSIWKIPLAINPLQILAIDLVWEMWPLMALTWDPADKDILTNWPRNVSKHVIDKAAIIDLIWSGFMMWILAFINYILYFVINDVSPMWVWASTWIYLTATSITYTSIVLAQYMNILSRRAGNKSVFSSYLRSNKKLLWSFVLSIWMILTLVYVPAVSNYFGFGRMNLVDRAYPIVAWIVFLVIREIGKLSKRNSLKS